VKPTFYDRDADGVPQAWIKRIKAAMRTLIPCFSAERMLRDYVDTVYRSSDEVGPDSVE